MRCFVAIELTPGIRSRLAEQIGSLQRSGREVRWCSADRLHVTLKFLGELSDGDVRRACDIAARAALCCSAFEIKVGGLGAFPSRRDPRVLWTAVDDPSGGCAKWLAAADPEFATLGISREARPFHPHVTLARSRSPAGNRILKATLAAPCVPATTTMRVETVTMFESRPGSSGSAYTAIAKASFGAV